MKRRGLTLAVGILAGVLALDGVAHAIIVRTAVAFRPVARMAVAGAAVVGTAAIVGSVVHSLPPSCAPYMYGAYTYQRCGSTWYQPQYSGTTVNYTVVNPPAGAAPAPAPAPGAPPPGAPPPR